MRKCANLLWVIAAVFAIAWAQKGGQVDRLDPSLNDIVSIDAKINKLAGGFKNLEGPVWVPKGG